MPQEPADRQQLAALEVMTHARKIAGGLAALGMTRDDAVAVLLHHDPVYLSVVHGCRIAGCRIRQISPHATREQIASTLAEPGIRVLFVHDYFLPVLAEPAPDIALIAVTPLALFPGAAVAAGGMRPWHAYHQWLPLQEERKSPLTGPRRGRRAREANADSAAVSGSTIGDSLKMLSAITAGAGGLPPPEDEA
ncbi:AMP-binding protein [Noviherbaspirillum aridicola]|uniref:AMP-dependent synthetase/ligase domain-containing protein n=1 Tax=Noviherbaspirillum aridicola TaxID=2849687 RepID=A0ABQ4PZ35_9BURK|nr:AMP-binding protein [Noviherbaspirillum aridicola]GIZ50016.1 hypothetical protein NCCP691_00300 [Noviherbaspirillum aridicola]